MKFSLNDVDDWRQEPLATGNRQCRLQWIAINTQSARRYFCFSATLAYLPEMYRPRRKCGLSEKDHGQ